MKIRRVSVLRGIDDYSLVISDVPAWRVLLAEVSDRVCGLLGHRLTCSNPIPLVRHRWQAALCADAFPQFEVCDVPITHEQAVALRPRIGDDE